MIHDSHNNIIANTCRLSFMYFVPSTSCILTYSVLTHIPWRRCFVVFNLLIRRPQTSTTADVTWTVSIKNWDSNPSHLASVCAPNQYSMPTWSYENIIKHQTPITLSSTEEIKDIPGTSEGPQATRFSHKSQITRPQLVSISHWV